MIQDSVTLKNRYLRFIQTVSERGSVYALKSENGFATSYSTQFEDRNGNPIEIICFWAEKVWAKSCAKDQWQEYQVTEIQLAEFMESWCVGMANDGLLIGTEFDQNLFGYEVEPLHLTLELIAVLKSRGITPGFRIFKGIVDLEKHIKQMLN